MEVTYKNFTEDMTRFFLFEPWSEETQAYLDSEFRRRFPGNYQIMWKLSEVTTLIEYEMIFDTPEDETLFVLKYL